MNITKNIHEWLFSLMPEATASIVEMALIAVVYLLLFAVAGLYLVLLERGVAAWFQLRLGPNRVVYQGLLQTMADALKLVSKELTGTIKADKFLYNLAPYFVIVTALMAMSPLGNSLTEIQRPRSLTISSGRNWRCGAGTDGEAAGGSGLGSVASRRSGQSQLLQATSSSSACLTRATSNAVGVKTRRSISRAGKRMAS